MSTAQTYQERVLRVLIHIQEHLDADLSLDELARVAQFSPFHFHRIFRGLVGESVKEHVRRLRLERAALRLRNADDAVINVALDAGYDSHEAFTRAFHAMFGCSPSEFRRVSRERLFGDAPSGIHYDPSHRPTSLRIMTNGGTPMDVRIEKLPTMKIAFARGVGPYAEAAASAWQRLCAWAGPRGLFGPQTLCLGICHDDPDVTPAEKIRYEAAITLGRPVDAEGEIGVREIPEGCYAIATLRGPYDQLAGVWQRLCGQWLPQSGRTLRDAPSFEIYRNNPQTTPPDQLVTDVCIPVVGPA